MAEKKVSEIETLILQLLDEVQEVSIRSIGLSASTPAIARPEPARNQTGLAGGESRLP